MTKKQVMLGDEFAGISYEVNAATTDNSSGGTGGSANTDPDSIGVLFDPSRVRPIGFAVRSDGRLIATLTAEQVRKALADFDEKSASGTDHVGARPTFEG